MICPSCKEDKLGTFVKQFIIAGLLPTRPFPTKVLNERYVCIECFRESNRYSFRKHAEKLKGADKGE